MTRRLFCFLFALALSAVASAATYPPGVNTNDALLKLGMLDVTKAPYNADYTGGVDCTTSLQQAVNDARDYDLICYLPSGTYLVSDTILGMRKCIYTGSGWRTDNHQCVIVGSSVDRPVIKLKANASGFQNATPTGARPVLWLYSMSAYGQQAECEGSEDPLCGQANINFNQSVRSIDFDLNGNPGAIGVWHDGAQGSTIEDIRVDATGAFAGFCNPPGQAGGVYNIEVEGGRYGMYIRKVTDPIPPTTNRHQARHTLIAGAVFKNQTSRVFHFEIYSPVVMVGFHIVKSSGPICDRLPEYDGLSMVDGVIELGSGKVTETTNIINGQRSNFYMRNVYVKGASEVTNGWTINNRQDWTLVKEYSYCESRASNLINGSTNKNQYGSKVEGLDIDGDEMAQAMVLKHVWANDDFLTFETPDIVNVKNSAQMNGSPAQGNGTYDDTAALEYAIAHYDNIFLPKGNYTIRRTLTLRENTRFFGVDRTLTSISSRDNWSSGFNAPLIDTVNSRDALTRLAYLSARSSHEFSWRAGKDSWVRSINTRKIHVHGNGGGRLSGIHNVGSQILVEGTHQPLHMYATNPERAADPQFEINGAHNVHLYFVKSEAGASGIAPSIPLKIINSSNIFVFGGTGNVDFSAQPGSGMVEIVNSDDVVVTQMRPWKTGTSWYTIKETRGSSTYTLPASTKLSLFKRGTPEDASAGKNAWMYE